MLLGSSLLATKMQTSYLEKRRLGVILSRAAFVDVGTFADEEDHCTSMALKKCKANVSSVSNFGLCCATRGVAIYVFDCEHKRCVSSLRVLRVNICATLEEPFHLHRGGVSRDHGVIISKSVQLDLRHVAVSRRIHQVQIVSRHQRQNECAVQFICEVYVLGLPARQLTWQRLFTRFHAAPT